MSESPEHSESSAQEDSPLTHLTGARIVSSAEAIGPRGALPAVVPAERVLARTEEVAVALSRLLVYPAGFEFEIRVEAADAWADLEPFEMGPARSGAGDEESSRGRLLIGLRFADGSEATADRRFDPGSGLPQLMPRSTGSFEGSWYRSLLVWPLPPAGRIEFLCEWPEVGIPLTACELDGAAIRAAAGRAEDLLPDG